MARLFADENFEEDVVEELRQPGHDILTARDAGLANQRTPDPNLLAFAVQDRRAVLTHNRGHFKRLHRQSASHAGIIICTVDQNYIALAHRIHDAILANAPLAGKLLLVYRPNLMPP